MEIFYLFLNMLAFALKWYEIAKICESENVMKQSYISSTNNNLFIFGMWLFFLLILDRFRIKKKKMKPGMLKITDSTFEVKAPFCGRWVVYCILYLSLLLGEHFHIKTHELNGSLIAKTVEYTEKFIPSMAVHLPQNCRFRTIRFLWKCLDYLYLANFQ